MLEDFTGRGIAENYLFWTFVELAIADFVDKESNNCENLSLCYLIITVKRVQARSESILVNFSRATDAHHDFFNDQFHCLSS